MKAIIIIISLVLLHFSVKAANYYIDPLYKGKSLGTIQQPYTRWEQIRWNDGDICLFKSGTIFYTSKSLSPEADNVTISSYGQGKRPVIIGQIGSNGRIFDFGALKNVLLKNIEVIANNGEETCIHFFKSYAGTVENCRISGSQWGIRNVFSTGLFRILNCEVFNTLDDGVFISDIDSIKIEKTHVYDVNKNYLINTAETFSGGDCVQLVNVSYFHITENILDHTSMGNKFCFISSSKSSHIIPSGIIEGNKFVRNKTSDDGDLLYLTGSENVIIRHNTFFYGDHAIYNHSSDIIIYRNLFVGQHVMAIYDEPKNITEILVYNNTFSSISKGIESFSKKLTAVNNIFYEISTAVFSGRADVISKNNVFYPKKLIGFNIKDTSSLIADPMFIDIKSNNYMLKNHSPCLGKAIKPENFIRQKSMALNRNSSANNIGAY